MSPSTVAEAPVWLITAASSGLGKLLALEVLKRGDKVIATSRNVGSLEPLKLAGATVMELDVTSPFETIKDFAAEAERVYGRIDVLVNGTGYPAAGPLEELGPEGISIQFDVNVFGVIKVTNAFLPYMRTRRAGTIVMIGSRSGWRTLAMTGAYSASKAALHAYADALALEVEPFGIRLATLIPGGFPTEGPNGFPSRSNPAASHPSFTSIDDYEPAKQLFDGYIAKLVGNQSNDPAKFSVLVADLVRGEGLMLREDGTLKPWPARLVIGSDAERDIRLKIASIESTMEEYPEFTRFTDRTPST